MDTYAHYIYLVGLGVIAIGCLGLVKRAFRHWRKGLGALTLIGLWASDHGISPNLPTASAD